MSKLARIPLATFLLITCAGAFAVGNGTPPRPEDAIRAADQAWMKVFAAKDLDRSVDYCLEDGSVLAPNAPIAVSHDGIRKLFAGFFALPNLDVSWQVAKAEVAKSGEIGYTSGTYKMTFGDGSGKTLTDVGKYLTIWKKQRDGSWKVFIDTFNSDLPASGAN